MEHDIIVGEDGTIQLIYSDEVVDALFGDEGEVAVRRASHVEPAGRMWQADLSPVGGPKLPVTTRRQDALDAEVEWLRREMAKRRLKGCVSK